MVMMMNTEKVTVSLPKVDLIRIAEYEKELKLSRSGIFKEAVELWLEAVRTIKMEKQYKKVYADKKIATEDKKMAENLLPVALEIWPKY